VCLGEVPDLPLVLVPAYLQGQGLGYEDDRDFIVSIENSEGSLFAQGEEMLPKGPRMHHTKWTY
jgi:hypothetical protein